MATGRTHRRPKAPSRSAAAKKGRGLRVDELSRQVDAEGGWHAWEVDEFRVYVSPRIAFELHRPLLQLFGHTLSLERAKHPQARTLAWEVPTDSGRFGMSAMVKGDVRDAFILTRAEWKRFT